jgi:hypothetical protein
MEKSLEKSNTVYGKDPEKIRPSTEKILQKSDITYGKHSS